MAYIGNTPADKFLTLTKQNFTTSATTSYTLDSSISSTQDIALFINNVRQSPVDAYTVSGTALTLTSATAGTDEMYCVYLGKTVGTVSPASDSVTTAMIQSNAVNNAKMADDAIGLSELSATGTASSSTFLRGDNSWASAGGNNTPSFRVILSGNQSIANSTATKITFDTETWDSDGTFASNKWTPAVAGKYLIVLGGRISGFTDAEEFQLYFKKNGSDLNFGQSKIVSAGTNPLFLAQQSTIIEDLSASDYIEGWTLQNTGSAADIVSTYTYMAGFKLIGV